MSTTRTSDAGNWQELLARTRFLKKASNILSQLKNYYQVPNKNPLFMMEEEQKEHVAKLNKMEREMEEVFERKVLRLNLIDLRF